MNIQFYTDELDYVNAKTHIFGGIDPMSFLGTFLRACLLADSENYELLRPVLAVLMKKYPADPRRLAQERYDNGRATDEDLQIRKRRDGEVHIRKAREGE